MHLAKKLRCPPLPSAAAAAAARLCWRCLSVAIYIAVPIMAHDGHIMGHTARYQDTSSSRPAAAAAAAAAQRRRRSTAARALLLQQYQISILKDLGFLL